MIQIIIVRYNYDNLSTNYRIYLSVLNEKISLENINFLSINRTLKSYP
jgi:hypothetical protein